MLFRNNTIATGAYSLLIKRWATNLGGGSTTNGRDSAGKRLGVKLGHGAKIKVGQIIVRQRGFQYYPGENVGIGRDHTFWAKCDGIVQFSRDYWKNRAIVSVAANSPRPLQSIFPAAGASFTRLEED